MVHQLLSPFLSELTQNEKAAAARHIIGWYKTTVRIPAGFPPAHSSCEASFKSISTISISSPWLSEAAPAVGAEISTGSIHAAGGAAGGKQEMLKMLKEITLLMITEATMKKMMMVINVLPAPPALCALWQSVATCWTLRWAADRRF